jgi:hypothetical protein
VFPSGISALAYLEHIGNIGRMTDAAQGSFAEMTWPARSRAARPDQLGHRDRLRQRAAKAGLDALPDYELLEIYLFRTFARGEVKPLAKALLARFGSLGGVFSASIAELKTVPGIGEAAAPVRAPRAGWPRAAVSDRWRRPRRCRVRS